MKHYDHVEAAIDEILKSPDDFLRWASNASFSEIATRVYGNPKGIQYGSYTTTLDLPISYIKKVKFALLADSISSITDANGNCILNLSIEAKRRLMACNETKLAICISNFLDSLKTDSPMDKKVFNEQFKELTGIDASKSSPVYFSEKKIAWIKRILVKKFKLSAVELITILLTSPTNASKPHSGSLIKPHAEFFEKLK